MTKDDEMVTVHFRNAAGELMTEQRPRDWRTPPAERAVRRRMVEAILGVQRRGGTDEEAQRAAMVAAADIDKSRFDSRSDDEQAALNLIVTQGGWGDENLLAKARRVGGEVDPRLATPEQRRAMYSWADAGSYGRRLIG